MEDLLERITAKPGLCGGKPTIKGMRIRVTDVLDLLPNGITVEDNLKEELPDLEKADILACLKYASQKLNYPVVHAAL